MFSLVWKTCALPSSRMGMDGHSVTAKLGKPASTSPGGRSSKGGGVAMANLVDNEIVQALGRLTSWIWLQASPGNVLVTAVDRVCWRRTPSAYGERSTWWRNRKSSAPRVWRDCSSVRVWRAGTRQDARFDRCCPLKSRIPWCRVDAELPAPASDLRLLPYVCGGPLLRLTLET